MAGSLKITTVATFKVKYAADENGIIIFTDNEETVLPWDEIIKAALDFCDEKMDGEWRDEALVFGKLNHLSNELGVAAQKIGSLLKLKFPNLVEQFKP